MFDKVCWFKEKGPISCKLRQNDNSNNNIQKFELSFELPFLLEIEVKLNLLDWNVNELENKQENM